MEEDPYETGIQIPVHMEEKAEIPVLLREDEAVEVKTEIRERIGAPVREGEQVGQVRYILDGKEIASFDVVTGKAVRKRDLRWAVSWVLQMLLY